MGTREFKGKIKQPKLDEFGRSVCVVSKIAPYSLRCNVYRLCKELRGDECLEVLK